mgnify:FL=1
MSTIDSILKPFKFVENELLAAVTKVYNVYHDKTGDDQYSLSNYYLTAAVTALGVMKIIRDGISPGTIGYIGVGAGVGAIAHQLNKKKRSLDQQISDSSESIKNYQREAIRNGEIMMGRGYLFLTVDSILEQTTGYSIIINTGNHPNEIANLIETVGLSFMTLFAYTAAIDNDKPAKSKLASIVKGMTSQPELVPIKIRSQ